MSADAIRQDFSSSSSTARKSIETRCVKANKMQKRKL